MVHGELDQLIHVTVPSLKAKEIYRWRGSSGIAKDIAHHPDESERTGITDPIIYAIGVLPGRQYPFFPKNGKMLRNITLRSSHPIDDIMHAHFVSAQRTKDSKTQRMGDRLHRA